MFILSILVETFGYHITQKLSILMNILHKNSEISNLQGFHFLKHLHCLNCFANRMVISAKKKEKKWPTAYSNFFLTFQYPYME